MKDDRMTKQKLQDVAKKEFTEKGFLQASLRNICKEAGVTTGALYFFFKDKEDLFASIVDEPLQRITEIMMQHYKQERENGHAVNYKLMKGDGFDYSNDVQASKDIIHYLFQYHEEMLLLLTKSQGTKYEHIVDNFISVTEKHYRELTDIITDQAGIPRKDDFFIHWVSHMNIDVFVHLLLHAKDEGDAQKQMGEIMKYMISGFVGLINNEVKY